MIKTADAEATARARRMINRKVGPSAPAPAPKAQPPAPQPQQNDQNTPAQLQQQRQAPPRYDSSHIAVRLADKLGGKYTPEQLQAMLKAEYERGKADLKANTGFLAGLRNFDNETSWHDLNPLWSTARTIAHASKGWKQVDEKWLQEQQHSKRPTDPLEGAKWDAYQAALGKESDAYMKNIERRVDAPAFVAAKWLNGTLLNTYKLGDKLLQMSDSSLVVPEGGNASDAIARRYGVKTSEQFGEMAGRKAESWLRFYGGAANVASTSLSALALGKILGAGAHMLDAGQKEMWAVRIPGTNKVVSPLFGALRSTGTGLIPTNGLAVGANGASNAIAASPWLTRMVAYGAQGIEGAGKALKIMKPIAAGIGAVRDAVWNGNDPTRQTDHVWTSRKGQAASMALNMASGITESFLDNWWKFPLLGAGFSALADTGLTVAGAIGTKAAMWLGKGGTTAFGTPAKGFFSNFVHGVTNPAQASNLVWTGSPLSSAGQSLGLGVNKAVNLATAPARWLANHSIFGKNLAGLAKAGIRHGLMFNAYSLWDSAVSGDVKNFSPSYASFLGKAGTAVSVYGTPLKTVLSPFARVIPWSNMLLYSHETQQQLDAFEQMIRNQDPKELEAFYSKRGLSPLPEGASEEQKAAYEKRKAEIDSDFYGMIRYTNATLPYMYEQAFGTIDPTIPTEVMIQRLGNLSPTRRAELKLDAYKNEVSSGGPLMYDMIFADPDLRPEERLDLLKSYLQTEDMQVSDKWNVNDLVRQKWTGEAGTAKRVMEASPYAQRAITAYAMGMFNDSMQTGKPINMDPLQQQIWDDLDIENKIAIVQHGILTATPQGLLKAQQNGTLGVLKDKAVRDVATDMLLIRMQHDGNFAADYMLGLRRQLKAGATKLDPELQKEIAEKVENMAFTPMFDNMDNAKFLELAKVMAKENGAGMLDALPEDRRKAVIQRFVEEARARTLQAWKEDPIKNTPKIAGLMLGMNGYEGAGEAAEDPVSFWGTLAIAVLGGLVLVSGGDASAVPSAVQDTQHAPTPDELRRQRYLQGMNSR